MVTLFHKILDLLTQNESPMVRKLDEEGLAWMIEKSGMMTSFHRKNNASEINILKSELLSLIKKQQSSIFFHHDNPLAEGISGDWISVGEGRWKISSGLNFNEMETTTWLELGGWMMYLSKSPINETINTFRSKPREIVQFLRRKNLNVLIDSFHDNNSWIICIQNIEDTICMKNSDLIGRVKEIVNLQSENDDWHMNLVQLKEEGVGKDVVYSILEELRSFTKTEKEEDHILGMMDVVWGYCSPQNRIWD